MGYKWVILSKLSPFESFELNMPSDRVFSELSEYQIIIKLGQTEVKLWAFKDQHTPLSLCL